MIDRKLNISQREKVLFLIITLLFLTLGFFVSKDVGDFLAPDDTSEKETPDVISSVISPINPPLKTQSENFLLSANKEIPSSNTDSNKSDKSGKKSDIKKLMDEQIGNDTRKIINKRLLSGASQYKFKETEEGGRRHRNDRWSAVAISLIDEDGNALMVDITSPLPLLEEN